ncbi:CLUMA_CG003179, isoform A [Clunio marinus]|uniref:CLUMA_CG003179, isoform A n=1 Tax=Clunio marinus TaxID=568069 RepID=A0A1J1HSH5_9DIPT|nr:CLUMA_CG003179, isoform A [Clunio marinus]
MTNISFRCQQCEMKSLHQDLNKHFMAADDKENISRITRLILHIEIGDCDVLSERNNLFPFKLKLKLLLLTQQAISSLKYVGKGTRNLERSVMQERNNIKKTMECYRFTCWVTVKLS